MHGQVAPLPTLDLEAYQAAGQAAMMSRVVAGLAGLLPSPSSSVASQPLALLLLLLLGSVWGLTGVGGLPASLPSLPQRSSSAAWCACGWAWRRCRVRSAASSAARSPRTALSTAWSAASAACAASRAARSPTSAASAAASPSAATCSRRRDSASFSRRREIWEQSAKGVAGEPAELGRAESRQTMQAG